MRNVVLGWSKACRVKKVKSCDPETFHYYRLGESKCRGLCTGVSRCLGCFYDKSSFKCWISYELGTLVKVSDSKKVPYIKTPNV
ncbi:hypothetical protein HID58_030827 [Brassica napus]|uniref:Apple domain-containing protein n=1 Tax=Brassica napus TaxID=3708 RepID=A0ABQ8CH11_BRANA|nr:hypothetical protein HID58_030827 [Brassica napus]